MQFVYLIEKAADGSYSAYLPDLPACTTCGDTVAEMRDSIKNNVDSYVEELRADNLPVPEPTTAADMVEAA